MFALFRLVKLLQFARNDQHETIIVLNNDCQEFEGKTSLALYFSNGYLLLWCSSDGEQPVVRQMSWLPNRHILSLCYEPTATLLLCCLKDALVIVPAMALLGISHARKAPWYRDDITEIKLPKIKGQVSSCKWWQSSGNNSIAVLATDAGHIYLLDLISRLVVHEINIEEHISNILIVQSTTLACTCALMTTKSNVVWRLLLEEKVNTQQLASGGEFVVKNKRAAPVIKKYISILDKHEGMSAEMTPQRLQQLPPSVILSTHLAKQREFVALCDLNTSIFQVYECDMAHSPLYIYHTPCCTESVLYTDKLLFLTSALNGHTLSVAANQLAEATPDKCKNQSVIQQFSLDSDEQIMSVYRHTSPPNSLWHVNTPREHSVWLEDIHEHTVLDGCILITNKAIYMCQPRVSPETVFLSLVYAEDEYIKAERLAYILSLDLNMLYTLAADRCLKDGNCVKATVLLQRARCPCLERLQLLVKHGFISETIPLLKSLTSIKGSTELSPAQSKLVAKHAIVLYSHQITSGDTTVMEDFRSFLHTNYYLEKDKTLQILLRTGQHDYFVDFAQERDVFVEAIQLLLSYQELSDLADEGDTCDPYPMVELPYHISDDIQIINDLLQLLDAHELVSLLDKDLSYVNKLTLILRNNLSILTEHQLLQVVAMFDVFRSPWRRWLNHAFDNDKHLSSDSSDDELGTCVYEEKPRTRAIGSIVSLFLCALVHLNYQRPANMDLASLTEVEDYTKPKICPQKNKPKASVPKEYVMSRPTLLACGVDFTAFVRNGDLYTWGCTQNGRLGHGDTHRGHDSIPQPIKLFTEICSRVISVSCGGKHCLALTEKGVYSWGSNRYGQLGDGTQRDSSSPLHIKTWYSEAVTAVICGHYHSLALTAESRVYSWGWGVHGQLGHGDSEDRHTPVTIAALHSLQAVMVAAGCMHTVVLTSQSEVYTFGCSNFGQLGIGETHKTTLPVCVKMLHKPIKMIATRYFHNLALGEDRKLFCWGSSPVQLRQQMVLLKRSKDTTHRNNRNLYNKHLLPSVIYTKNINGNIIKLCCGNSYSAVLTDSGEVYTWGVNSDGQLATGNKMNEPIPHLVRGLGDARMVSIAAGHSFMVGLDTSGDLHSWGNNDKGQLGVRPCHPGLVGNRTSSILPGLLGCSQFRLMMDTNSVLDPVRVDGRTLSRVRNLRCYKEELAQAAVAEEWWLEKLTPSQSPLSSRTSIPDLAGQGPVLYPPQSVLHTLIHLSQHHHRDVLELCLQLKDWHMAARVELMEQRYNKALEYHFNFIAGLNEQIGPSLEDVVIKVISHYVVLYQTTDVDTLVVFCELVMNFWQVHPLPMISLQEFVLKFKSVLSLPFFLMLARDNGVDRQDCDKSLGDKFNLSFLLGILEEVMQSGDIHKSTVIDQYLNQLLSGKRTSGSTSGQIPETTSEITDSKSWETKSETGDGKSQEAMSESGDGKSQEAMSETGDGKSQEAMSETVDGKSQEILEATDRQSQEKSSSVCNNQPYIHISKETLTSLLSWDGTQSREESSSTGNISLERAACREIVAFSCGHHYNRDMLLSTLIPEMEMKLVLNEPSMVQTAAVLVEQYKSRDKMRMGCPQCVCAALM